MWFSYFLIVLSACLFSISYAYPAPLWWGTVISLALVMCIRISSPRIALLAGILWGACVYTLLFSGVVKGIVTLASYASFYAWLPGIVLIIYLALSTGLWWMFGIWCEQYLLYHLQWNHSITRAVWLWFYWLWITYCCLLPCGRCEGYLLANPLIPWAAHPQLLWPVSWFGIIGATLFLCMLSALIARNSTYAKYFLLCIAIFLIGVTFIQHDVHICTIDCWHKKISVITKPIVAVSEDPSICMLISEYVACAHTHNPEMCAIIFPESCIYPWRICAESLLASYIPACDTCDYIIGSFYDDNGLFRNSCYWLHNGILQKRFDKRHAMPLIERLPWFLQCSALKELFFATMPEIIPSSNERPVMKLGDIHAVPYICSELFFNRYPDDQYSDLPIVALINDRWAPPYLQELMYLGAVIQAYAWHREIVYASYTRYAYIKGVVHRHRYMPSDQ